MGRFCSLERGAINISSAYIYEEKADCSTQVEIGGHRKGAKGIQYSFMATSVFLSRSYHITWI